MHNTFLKFTLFLLVPVLVSSRAHASVLTDLLTFDGPVHHTSPVFQGGGEDKIQDDSLSGYVDLGAAGFSVGDILYGLINVSNINSSGVGAQGVGEDFQVTILFATKIIGAGSLAGSVALGPIADILSDYDLRNLVSPSLLDDFTTGPDDDSIFIVASNQTGTDEAGGINPLDLNANVGGAVDANSIETNITNANGWFGDVIGGLLTGDFYEFLGASTAGGTQRGGFSVQESNFPAIFLPVDVVNFAGTTSYHDVTLDFGTVNIASADEQGRGWAFTDQSTFYVNAVVPEPVSLIVWLALCSAVGIVGSRRRIG